MYVDETGNLDYDGSGKAGASQYFGFGSAVFDRAHGEEMFRSMRLRAALERNGVSLMNGFHAVEDGHRTKTDVFKEIHAQRPRFDTTFLLKANALPHVRNAGQMRLYQMAWFLHFKEVAKQVSEPADTLFVIAGSFGTRARQKIAGAALTDVCNQVDREIVLCVWTAASSWGLQVADYGLWATQRALEGRTCTWFEPYVQPTLRTEFLPWGGAQKMPAIR